MRRTKLQLDKTRASTSVLPLTIRFQARATAAAAASAPTCVRTTALNHRRTNGAEAAVVPSARSRARAIPKEFLSSTAVRGSNPACFADSDVSVTYSLYCTHLHHVCGVGNRQQQRAFAVFRPSLCCCAFTLLRLVHSRVCATHACGVTSRASFSTAAPSFLHDIIALAR